MVRQIVRLAQELNDHYIIPVGRGVEYFPHSFDSTAKARSLLSSNWITGFQVFKKTSPIVSDATRSTFTTQETPT